MTLREWNENQIFTLIGRWTPTGLIAILGVTFSLYISNLNQRFDAVDQKFAVAKDVQAAVTTRVASLETNQRSQDSMLQRHDDALITAAKSREQNLPRLAAVEATTALLNDRQAAMASAMQDVRKGMQDVSTGLNQIAIQIAGINARLPAVHGGLDDGPVGIPGARTTQIEPLSGAPKLP